MSNGKLKIYLADLDHFFPGSCISVPLNIGSIMSYCKNLYKVEISLFKNPEKLMQAIKSFPPDILGLSFYIWNTNLTLKVMECCKSINSQILTVIGGPSVARNTDHYKTLLSNPNLDIVVLDQGEKSFANIINRIPSKEIPGCAIRLNGRIKRGIIVDDFSGLDKIPSPYLKGYLDKFLRAGFLPTFETVRGCPHQCTYCGGGDEFYSRLIVKDEKVVYEELLYLLKYSKRREIDLIDTNFGIMGDRDLRISAFIYELYRKHNFPQNIGGAATTKVKSKRSIEIMTNLVKINGVFHYGLQTLTKKVLFECRRKNIPNDMIREIVTIARKNNLSSGVDLIFGLPGETKRSFLKTIDKIVSLGIELPEIFQLKILPGTELSKNREKYKYVTKSRPVNNRFGEYRSMGRIMETEEIACGSNTFDYDDYLEIRVYGFLMTLFLNCGIFTDAISYLSTKGIRITKIIDNILKYKHPIINDYKMYADREFDCWNKFKREKYFKLNLGFAGYCMFENIEFLERIEQIIRKIKRTEEFNEVLKHDKLCRIIQTKKEGKLKASDIVEEISFEEHFDYENWKANGFKGVLLKLNTPVLNIYHIRKYNMLIQKIKEYSNFSGYYFYERILLYGPRDSFKRYCKSIEQTSGEFL